LKPFELLVLVRPGLGDEGLAACRQRVEGWLAESGASVEDVVDCGELQLNYEIRKQSRGHFMLFWLQGPGELPEAVGKRIRVDEEIIRHLMVDRHPAALKFIKMAGEERERGDGKRGQ